MKWERPIIETDLVKLAEDKLLLIYNNLLRNRNKQRNYGLYSGRMGYCLFFFYYELFTKKKKVAEKYLYEINALLSKIADDFNYILWFSEFGWLLQHLKRRQFIDFGIDDILSGLDECLQEIMTDYIHIDHYEVIYGATNIANYFLYRNENVANQSYDLYLDTLYKKAIYVDKDKITWLSYMDILTKKDNEKHVNLGLAHGIPALLLFFCKLKSSNYQHKYLDELLIKTCNYILSIENDDVLSFSHFPSTAQINIKKSQSSRIGWCYGDLAIGYALLCASEFYPEIKTKSLDVLIDTTKRRNNASIFDDCLCHGTLGTAQMYHRIYSLTNMDRFKETAFYWYEKGIRSKYRHNCAAGIGFFADGRKYISNYGFLSGIPGIGLSLISAISEVNPLWDECLLIS